MFDCTEVTDVDDLTPRLVTSDSGLRAIDFDLSRRREGSRRGIHPIASEAARAENESELRWDGTSRSLLPTEKRLLELEGALALPLGY